MIKNYGMTKFNCFYCPETWVIFSDDINSEDYYLERAKAKLYRYEHTEREHKKEIFSLDNTTTK